MGILFSRRCLILPLEQIGNFPCQIISHRFLEVRQCWPGVSGDGLIPVRTIAEQKAVDDYEHIARMDKVRWGEFTLESLFGKATRGKRLKSADRIPGPLPFVTAGEKEEGVSAFIGNDVVVFSENTTTIDMFGSAKYRNYAYGADDHVAVVHTENLPRYAAIFVTAAIHKSSCTGKFDYGRNFYSKDADDLVISLPVKNGMPDYKYMTMFISAIQKLVISDVVLFTERHIASHQAVTKTT